MERLKAGWRDVERSLFLRVQVIRIEALHLRGRAALMAAPAGKPGAALRQLALADARRLDKENVHWGSALATLLRAGISAQKGEAANADELVARAIDELEALDMHLWAKAARWARGERGAVDDWMRKQNMRNPARMVALLVPGFEPLGG
jgi:hypothetical protein